MKPAWKGGGTEYGSWRKTAPQPYLPGTGPKSLTQTAKKGLRIFEEPKMEQSLNIFSTTDHEHTRTESISKPNIAQYSREELKKIIDSPPSVKRPLQKGRYHMRIEIGKVQQSAVNRTADLTTYNSRDNRGHMSTSQSRPYDREKFDTDTTAEMSNSLVLQSSGRKKRILMSNSPKQKKNEGSPASILSKEEFLTKVERGRLCSEREKKIMKPIAQAIYTPRDMVKISHLQNLSTRAEFVRHCYYRDFPTFHDWNLCSGLRLKVRIPPSQRIGNPNLVETRQPILTTMPATNRDSIVDSRAKVTKRQGSIEGESFSEVENVTVYPEKGKRVIIDLREVTQRSRERFQASRRLTDQRTLSREVLNHKEEADLTHMENSDVGNKVKQTLKSREEQFPVIRGGNKTPIAKPRLPNLMNLSGLQTDPGRGGSSEKIIIMDPQEQVEDHDGKPTEGVERSQRHQRYLFNRYLPNRLRPPAQATQPTTTS